jgi:sodium pump decarboxylase gamma subunit
MESLRDIAITGAPAIVTALGMGTVFSCLLILYVLTRLTGRWLPRLLGTDEGEAPAESVESAVEARVAETAAAPQESPAGDEAIVAAMTLALTRHRSSRLKSAEEPRGADPWKIAGRLRTLRVR